MRSEPWHQFEHEGKRYTFKIDDMYEVERSCGSTGECDVKMHGPFDSLMDMAQEEAACDYYYEDEVSKLDRGEWIALWVMVERKCDGIENYLGHESHCKSCSGWIEDEELPSVGGIVIDNSYEAAEKFVKDGNL